MIPEHGLASAFLKPLTLYYDGSCPLCLAEITFLKNRNQKNLIIFVDISTHPEPLLCEGLSCEQASRFIHGKIDNQLIMGVQVFSEIYQRVDLVFLAKILGSSKLRPILVFLYKFFAAYRGALSRWIGPPLLKMINKRYRLPDNNNNRD